MTKEDAIKILNTVLCFGKCDCTKDEIEECLKMAIKVLQQQPSEGEQIIRISKGTLKARTGRYVIYDVEWLKEHFNTTEAKIYGQPQPSERTETHECDCISRKDIGLTNLEILMCNGDYKEALKMLLGKIEKAPSVNPQPKTGHWEWVQYESKPNFGNWHCSECRCILCGAINGNPIRLPKYCPECGAKMQEVQE